jgi:capsule polysaccharide export protein KpsE/RkpR
MKKLLAVLFLALAAALTLPAQSAPTAAPAPTVEQLKSFVTVMRQQRDANAQAAQDAQAQIQLLSAEVESLKKQLADAQTKLAAATKPKDADKVDDVTPASPPKS